MRFLSCLLAAGCIASGTPALAANIKLVGVVRDSAVLTVDGGEPAAYPVGSTIVRGYTLLAVRSDGATIDERGKPVTLAVGRYPAPSGANQTLILHADGAGQFFTNGSINGANARMLVDTGASTIAMPAADAARFGIDYRKGRPGRSSTANGIASVFMVHVESIRIGDVEVKHFDAIVHETGLPIVLLGSNFLDRFSMRRERQEMILTPHESNF
jgi:aspartyl protease family protein